MALAEMEYDLWNKVKAEAGPGVSKVQERRDWFHKNFGGAISSYEHRASVYRAGAWAHHLFQHVDEGKMSLSQAAEAVRVTKKEAAVYDIDPATTLGPILKKMRTKLTFDDDPASAKVEELLEDVRISRGKEEPKTDITFSKHNTSGSKEFKRQMHLLGEKFVEAQFANFYVDEYHKARLIKDFKVSLDQLIDEFRHTVTRTKNKTKNEGIEEIGENLFQWACDVFAIVVEFGKPVDMKRIQKLRIRRMRDLHPDRNPSKEAEAEYRAVNDAYNILNKYSQRNNSNTKRDD